MKIIADRNIPFLHGVCEYFGETEYIAGAEFTHDKIKNADTLIVRTVARFDEAVLRDTKVKLICSATIGYDHIDTRYCDTHGIVWKNAPGCNSGSVQQYVVSSLLVLARQKGFDLRQKTIGVVGVGNVGKKVARACEILGMRVLLNDPPREKSENNNLFVSLETIKREADIITIHTPLTKDGEFKTFHLLDDDFFSSLTQKPIIINSARGGIIETNAIKHALKQGLISGAVIDCWENEPDIDTEYMNMVDIATPHIAGYSADGKANATRMSLESIADFYHLDKTIINTVKPPAPSDFIIDLSAFDNRSRIEDTILTTYNPVGDYDRLKAAPDTFKQLRNEYPLRREYLAYTVKNATEIETHLLALLGFITTNQGD